VSFLKQFAAPDTGMNKVSFGTEGGLFKQRLDVPVVVCGPGSIEQAHKPDEFIEVSQMDAGERFLQGLLGSLKA
jgi:acetylornithine deacetylase